NPWSKPGRLFSRNARSAEIAQDRAGKRVEPRTYTRMAAMVCLMGLGAGARTFASTANPMRDGRFRMQLVAGSAGRRVWPELRLAPRSLDRAWQRRSRLRHRTGPSCG